MKHINKTLKNRKQNPANQTQRQSAQGKAAKPLLPRWVVLALCLLLAGGGTYAFCTQGIYFIWPKLPLELVGKWEVSVGPHRGDIFEFSRNGHLEAHINRPNSDLMDVMLASCAVDNKKLLVTTRNPHTGRDDTKSCSIRELTSSSFVVEFDSGEVFRDGPH